VQPERDSLNTGEVVIRGVLLSISCLVTYSVITHILAAAYSVSRDDDLLGGMWAMVATVFAYRYSEAESVRAALSRVVATSVSFGLCLGYLLLFPFNVWGMTVLIGVGTIVITMMGRPDDAITAGITIAVIMIVAEISPQHAWRQPVLRLVDTVVGVAIGVAAAWVLARVRGLCASGVNV
jgi:uncharacterized membrane protein YgaE (UPF0421/DUF939 family)